MRSSVYVRPSQRRPVSRWGAFATCILGPVSFDLLFLVWVGGTAAVRFHTGATAEARPKDGSTPVQWYLEEPRCLVSRTAVSCSRGQVLCVAFNRVNTLPKPLFFSYQFCVQDASSDVWVRPELRYHRSRGTNGVCCFVVASSR